MDAYNSTTAIMRKHPGLVYPVVKRVIDVIAALFVLAVSSPIWISAMIILKLTGEHEVFYFQERIGYWNNKFKIWKFASMLKASPSMGTGSLTVRNDPRVLPVGKYLRMTKVNELPQIINVLLGDMSIVGPRPQMEVDFECYSERVRKVMYTVKPGMTGIGSVVFRDEEKLLSNCSLPPHEYYAEYIAPYKGELEIWYLQHRSLWVDFLLVVLTGWVLFNPRSSLHYRLLKSLPPRPGYLAVDSQGNWKLKTVSPSQGSEEFRPNLRPWISERPALRENSPTVSFKRRPERHRVAPSPSDG